MDDFRRQGICLPWWRGDLWTSRNALNRKPSPPRISTTLPLFSITSVTSQQWLLHRRSGRDPLTKSRHTLPRHCRPMQAFIKSQEMTSDRRRYCEQRKKLGRLEFQKAVKRCGYEQCRVLISIKNRKSLGFLAVSFSRSAT
ncbi:hypothetical protein M378DRAFT_171637 [Amanita muscaria Koide BX008]|uniref:Uncharacterized protein n=1 Tax=Amanita muscaria (strain Koide BX008) TaxID=946122 RepID=A0A0C2S4G6_AMAMK|nr:hypothetical protein M378DRAFT_171637 [Amanita muscaria Koide BX008]